MGGRIHKLLACLLLVSGVGPHYAATAAEPAGYRIVVHVDNPLARIDKRQLNDLFLKRATDWPNGEAAKPVDQATGADVRRKFAEEVLGRSVSAVRSYWQQRIFSGRELPPPELDSDAAVIEYVAKHRGGVGYVSERANVGAVKVLLVD